MNRKEYHMPRPVPDPSRPLSGITVVDLSWHLAGPYSTMILADLGARVIKVEPPGSRGGYDPGGIIRHMYHGEDLHYISVNRSKESLTLDLKQEEGRADFYRLTSAADVVFNNFRPGVTKRLGVDFDTLVRYNPTLIYGSVSSFGLTGPDALKPGVDLVLQAMSGGMSMTGHPGSSPVRAGIPIADLAGAMWAALAVLGAIIRRQNGWDKPQQFDTSLLDGQLALFPYFAAYALNAGFVAGPQGSGGHSPTYGAFKCADGTYLVIAVIDQKPWLRLCRALDRLDWVDDARFLSPASRIEHTPELTGLLAERFADLPRAQWLQRLADNEISSGPVNDLAEALDEEQVRAREMVIQVPHLLGGQVELVASPIRMSDFQPEYRSPPTAGSDTEALAKEFGLRSPQLTATTKETDTT
jgi:CoA:oxalate CoA-transferase